jgi:hypothetical protein
MNSNTQFQPFLDLNLEPIKVKLMHEESGEGWSFERATAVEKEYRRFLFLMKLFPEDDTAPVVDVDTFWHYHILDTMKYAADCEQAFGYFLHHYPYVGMRGEGDEVVRQDSAERMRGLYEQTFGEKYVEALTQSAANAAAYCGAGVKAAYCGAGAKAAYCGTGVKASYCGAGVKAAYCGAGAKAAYCGAAVNAAYCGAGAKASYCGAGVKASYCGAGAKDAKSRVASMIAYCGAGAKTAYCGAGVKAANSDVGPKAAYCGAAAKTAYCGATVRTAYCGAGTKTLYCGEIGSGKMAGAPCARTEQLLLAAA